MSFDTEVILFILVEIQVMVLYYHIVFKMDSNGVVTRIYKCKCSCKTTNEEGEL